MSATQAPRPLTHDDLDWAVEASRARRAALAPHAPRFWRPAADAVARHRAFLAHLVDDDAALTLRTEHGFVVALPGERRRMVDDMVVPATAWATEGAALLGAVLDAGGPVRFVAPAAEPERRACAEALGLAVAEVWWHRDLPVVQVRGDGGNVRLDARGASGRLVPSPPVFDPGGSILLVTQADDAQALAAVEADAAERGAVVSVVVQRPDDLMRELLLVDAGHRVTTHFLEGERAPA